MTDIARTPLDDLGTEELARLLMSEAMLGGPDDDCADPVLLVLWEEAKRYMLADCMTLASALSEETGYPVIAIECRAEQSAGPWSLRHAAASPCPREEIRAAITAGRGMEIPVIDAIGAGTFDGRMDLYWRGGDEYRVILVDEERPAWLGDAWTRPIGYDPAVRLPGLALALGRDFNLRTAVAAILEDGGHAQQLADRIVAMDGLRIWAAGELVPSVRPSCR